MVRKCSLSAQDVQGPAIAFVSAAGVVDGIRRLLPVAVFVAPFGMAFGVAATEQGLTVAQSTLMSAVVFSGAAQFAALEFWGDPIAYSSLALVVVALNMRLVVMGAALSRWVNHLPAGQRVLVLGWLSDANFTECHTVLRSGKRDIGVLLGGGLALWGFWVVGTLVGAVAGAALVGPEAFGFDVVMVCFFAAIVSRQVNAPNRLSQVAAAALVAALTLDWAPFGWNVILGALAGGLLGLRDYAG